MNIDRQVLRFFRERLYEGTQPLLLGCSGGPDSLALLLAVLRLKMGRLLVAHIDHSWRPESSQEAQQLKELCSELGVPFFLKTLEVVPTKNIEDEGRRARLAFFKDIYQQEACQALLLGHHADDRAETVLKRLFEGASLSKMKGLKEVSIIEDMVIWRPLLDVQKKEISSYLEKKNAIPFVDATNLDSRFLRGRMRTHIFPLINTYFGKNITPTLNRFAEQAEEISEYLEKRIEPFLQNHSKHEWGILYDFSACDLHPLEWRCIANKLCPEASRQIREEIASSLHSRAANKVLGSVYLDRGCLFIRFRQEP